MLQFSPAGAADVVSADTLQKWHVEKANGGPTFSGSPAWLAHMAFVEAALRERGVVDLEKEEIDYRRWFASDDPDADDRALTIDGRQVSVASYWAYSGRRMRTVLRRRSFTISEICPRRPCGVASSCSMCRRCRIDAVRV